MATRLENLEKNKHTLSLSRPSPPPLFKASQEPEEKILEIEMTKKNSKEKPINGYHPPKCLISLILPYLGYFKISYRELVEWEGDVLDKLQYKLGQEPRNGLAPLDQDHLVLKIHQPGNKWNHYSIQDIKDCKGQLANIHPVSLAEPFTDTMKFRPPRSPSRKPFNKAQSPFQPSSTKQQLKKAADALARAINNLN